MTGSSLTTISQEMKDLALQREMILISCEGQLTEEIEKEISEIEIRLASLLVQNKDKISNYCLFLDSIDAEVAFCEEKIRQAQVYVKKIKNSQDWLLEIAKAVILKLGDGEKLEGNFGNRISLRKSTSTEVNINPSELPIEYQKIEVKADVAKIKAALNNSVEIEGCKLVHKQSVNWR